VSGRVVGRHIAEFVRDTKHDVALSVAEDAISNAEQRAAQLLENDGDGPNAYELRDAMGDTMIAKVGIFRTEEELAEAVEELQQLHTQCDRVVLRSKVPGMNPELSFALRLKGMVRLALVTAMGALARTESRGAHFRTDYPLRDDAKWLNRTLVRWVDGAPAFSYEPVGKLDVPPGHRGYGSDERIEMDQPIDDYNRHVEQAQVEQGKLPTKELQ
jgi:fumarate reductase flavoprotein subunit